MANPTNFLRPSHPRPQGPRQWYAVPRVKQFTNTDPQQMEDNINAWLDSLGTPFDPQVQYYVTDVIFYTSANSTGSEIQYSAMLHYNIWTAV